MTGVLGLLPWVAMAAAGGPPSVVRTSPSVWETDVDPSLTQIEVEFDTEMSERSYSIVGGGPHFPRDGVAEDHWLADHRTFILTVRLVPDKLYSLHFNAGPFDGFRSADDVPAIDYHLVFVTAAGLPTKRQRERNERSFLAITQEISRNYAHLNALPPNWEEGWDDSRDRILASGSSRAFASAVSSFFSGTCDDHLYWTYRRETYASSSLCGLTVNGASGGSWVDGFVAPQLSWQSDSRSVSHAELGGNLVIRIAEWDRSALAAADLVSGWPANKGIIFDVRENSGGDELAAQRIAGCFSQAPAPYAKAVVREDGAWSEPFERTVPPNPACSSASRVVVLQDGQCRSACESFLLMMRAVGATSLGQQSAGSSGRPVAVGIGQGIRMHTPSWMDFDLTGAEIERNGVAPDVVVDLSNNEVDQALLAASEKLAKRP